MPRTITWQVATGDRAREFYLKAVAIDRQHPNANLQLARMSVEEKQGQQAVAYLHRLPESTDPGMFELRACALGLSGQCSQAAEIAKRLDSQTAGDWRVHFSAGSIYAGCKIWRPLTPESDRHSVPFLWEGHRLPRY